MTQESRNNEWDPESNAQELNEGLFRRGDIDIAASGPHPGLVGASGMLGISGFAPGYATWGTTTYTIGTTTDYITTAFIEVPPYTPHNEFTYYGSSWKDTLEASLFLIKNAFKLIWRKYLGKKMNGVGLICPR